MSKAPSTPRWPTPYILEIYNAAVEHGYLRIEPLSAEQAKSLTQTIYRFRRRSDTGKAAFMRPEFQLITCSPWQSWGRANCNLGYMHVVFSSDPDMQLPKLILPELPDEADVSQATLQPISPPPDHIGNFIQDLLDKSQKEKD